MKETEIKLSFKSDALESVMNSPLFNDLGAPQSALLMNYYYDTGDLTLNKKKECLRIRVNTEEQTYVQTYKSNQVESEGTLTRDEVEVDVEGMVLDYSHIPYSEEDSLKPLFVTMIQRHKWEVEASDPNQPEEEAIRLEVALDIGYALVVENDVVKSEPRCSINEIEIELKAGDPEVLERLSRDFINQLPCLKVETETKAQKGYKLLEGNDCE